MPQAEVHARLGLFDADVKDEDISEGGEEAAGSDATGDPAADAERAEREVAETAKREGFSTGDDDEDGKEADPNPTGKPRYKRSPLDPVAMGRGMIKTVDSITMFAYKVGVRDHISREELEQGVADMALDKDQVDWAASDLADLMDQLRKSFTPETRVAISSGPLLGMRVIDVIDRILAARKRPKEGEKPTTPGGYPGAARFQTMPVK